MPVYANLVRGHALAYREILACSRRGGLALAIRDAPGGPPRSWMRSHNLMGQVFE
jgi:hypothetical protein